MTPEQRKAAGKRLAEGRRKKRELQLQATTAASPPVPPKRVLTWNDLPHDARKCAKRPGIPDNAPVHKMRCSNCRLEMWSRDEKMEDLCETCEFLLIDEKHRLRGQREKARGGQFVNPFGESEGSGTATVNPFGGGGKLL